MKIINRWFSSECWLSSNIPSMKLYGVECEMFINCEKYCQILFHSCLVFKQGWNKWSGVSSSLQYEQRGESTFLKLKSILFRYKTLFKGCVHYIFASLFCMSKKSSCERRKNALFHFESSSRSWDNQLLTF